MSKVQRGFALTRERKNGDVVIDEGEEVLAYSEAKIPEYQTPNSAGADFFCAERVVVPSIWSQFAKILESDVNGHVYNWVAEIKGEGNQKAAVKAAQKFKPTLVHTGIKAYMGEDEVLELYNRSSNPLKRGLVLANGVGVVDSDYVDNPDNDGEIMFAFYNFLPWSVTIDVGERIGQGVFKKFLKPTFNVFRKNTKRVGGFGSTEE